MTRRMGFSLLELMIAIMILGIGIVMVATIFPVGLDMTRQTVQMDISQAVTDAAVATLTAKVPGYKNLDKRADASLYAISKGAGRVLVPDILKTEISGSISANAAELLDPTGPNALVGPMPRVTASYFVKPTATNSPFEWAWPEWHMDLDLNGEPEDAAKLTPVQAVDSFLKQTRVFTEQSGWPGETNPYDEVSVVPYQNLRSDYLRLAGTSGKTIDDLVKTMIPPVFCLSGMPLQQVGLPCVHFLDQVFPPFPAEGLYTSSAPNDPAEWRPSTSLRIADLVDAAQKLASRRYAWVAFNHRVSADPKQIGLMASIAITYRGDLNVRYAQQKHPYAIATGGYYPYFDFNRTGSDLDETVDACVQPRPDDDKTTDVVFPVPWLIRFPQVNLNTGEIVCTEQVARLLPAGSYFIFAKTVLPIQAGTFQKVLTSDISTTGVGKSWRNYVHNATTNDWSRLTVARGSGFATDILAWVIPPGLERSGTTGTFQARSPVVGVALRKVVAP